jgi:hypothetical protein
VFCYTPEAYQWLETFNKVVKITKDDKEVIDVCRLEISML